jgi:hypothetical protein
MSRHGFDRIIFSLMMDHETTGHRAGHGIVTNYPPDWMRFYFDRRYDRVDSVRQYVHVAEGAFTWRSLPAQLNLTRSQRECLRLREEAGLKDGIGAPLREPWGAVAGIGAASSADGIRFHRDLLSHVHLLSQQFYTCYLALERKPQQRKNSFVILSRQEREVLKWCGARHQRKRGKIPYL